MCNLLYCSTHLQVVAACSFQKSKQTLFHCWHAQVDTGIFMWTTRFPTPVGVLMTVLPRYQEARVVRSRCATCAHPVRSGRSTCASCAQPVRNLGAACAASAQPMRDQVATDSPRKTSWWTLDWPVGSSNHTPSFRANITPMLVRCTTLILLVHIPFACTPVHTDTHGSLYYSSGPPGSRVTSSSVSTVHTQWFWDTIRVTAPLGAVCSHMSHTPSSDVSILRSPGDLHVVEHIPDPIRSDATKRQTDSGDADTSTAAPGTAATAPVGVPKSATPIHHVPDRHSQVDWADHEVFHFDPEIHRISAASSAPSHPVGVQYGPARQSRRACAKMLVRAGHRCPTCFCLTSLCRCQRERVTCCLPSLRCSCFGHSPRACALLSLSVSQAGGPSLHFRLASQFLCNPRRCVQPWHGSAQHELSASLPMAGLASLLLATTTTSIPSQTRALVSGLRTYAACCPLALQLVCPLQFFG